MARVTLLQLRTWARQLSNVENDPNITDAELNSLANRHRSELYDQLVEADPSRYASTKTMSTSAGTIAYALDFDFRNLLDVYVQVGTDGAMRQLSPIPAGSLGRYIAPQSAYSITVEYIPTMDDLVADTDVFDDVSGFAELVANLMAKDVMKKRQDDPSIVLNDVARLHARINAAARRRNRGQPKRITDLDESRGDWFDGWIANGSNLTGYRLRGDNLELYATR